jgi:hypothetical protein
MKHADWRIGCDFNPMGTHTQLPNGETKGLGTVK